jgi:hypothetical protein
MNNTIEINVIGKAMSGKIVISQEIVDTLRALGFNVQWNVGPDYKTEFKARKVNINRFKRLIAIQAQKTKIIINEVQAARELKF